MGGKSRKEPANGCVGCFFNLFFWTGAVVDPSAPHASDQPEQEITEKNGLRLCEHCFNLIELRKQVQDTRNAKTVLVTAYEQMRSLMDQARPAVAMYEKVHWYYFFITFSLNRKLSL